MLPTGSRLPQAVPGCFLRPARLAVSYLNDKAKPYIEPVAREVGAELLLPLDVTQDAQLEAVFERITQEWGGLDFMLVDAGYHVMS